MHIFYLTDAALSPQLALSLLGTRNTMPIIQIYNQARMQRVVRILYIVMSNIYALK
jgi:hypothetical protein